MKILVGQFITYLIIQNWTALDIGQPENNYQIIRSEKLLTIIVLTYFSSIMYNHILHINIHPIPVSRQIEATYINRLPFLPSPPTSYHARRGYMDYIYERSDKTITQDPFQNGGILKWRDTRSPGPDGIWPWTRGCFGSPATNKSNVLKITKNR